MSWLHAHTLRLGAYARSASGRVTFAIELQAHQQRHGRGHVVADRSYSEFRGLWKSLQKTLKELSFPRKQLLQQKDKAALNRRRVDLEAFLTRIQAFFCGYPVSTLETAALLHRCEVLRQFTAFVGLDEGPAALLGEHKDALVENSRPQRVRYWSICSSEGSRATLDSSDAPEEEEESSRDTEEHVAPTNPTECDQDAKEEPFARVSQDIGRTDQVVAVEAAEPPSPPCPRTLPQLQIKAADVQTFTPSPFELRDQLLRETSPSIQATLAKTAQLSDEELWELALFAASARGLYSDVMTILRRGTDPNAVVRNGLAALHAASRAGHLNVAQCLLGHGADIDKSGNMGMTPLMCAVNNDHIELVKLLLRARADVNKCNLRNVSAVHIAVANESTALLVLLLDHGGAVDSANSVNGKTPLHIAAESGNPEICELVLNAQRLARERRYGSGSSLSVEEIWTDEAEHRSFGPLEYIDEDGEDAATRSEQGSDVAMVPETETGTLYAVL